MVRKSSGRTTLPVPEDGSPINLAELIDFHKDEIVAIKALVVASEEVKQLANRRVRPEDDEVWLVRYLLNVKYTVQEAAQRFITMILTRHAEPRIDAFHEMLTKDDSAKLKEGQITYPHAEHIFQYVPERLLHMYDKHGQPISVQCLGRSDLKKFLTDVIDSQFEDYALCNAEFKRLTVDLRSRETNQLVQYLQVVDLSGLGMTHINRAALGRVNKMTKKLDLLYKECLGRIWVTNAPGIFRAVYSAAKFVMNERTAAKIMVIGADLSKMSPMLDVSALPDVLHNPKGPGQPTTGIAFPDAAHPLPPDLSEEM